MTIRVIVALIVLFSCMAIFCFSFAIATEAELEEMDKDYYEDAEVKDDVE